MRRGSPSPFLGAGASSGRARGQGLQTLPAAGDDCPAAAVFVIAWMRLQVIGSIVMLRNFGSFLSEKSEFVLETFRRPSTLLVSQSWPSLPSPK